MAKEICCGVDCTACGGGTQNCVDALIDRVEKAEAERDRLKTALTRLRHSWPTEEQTAWAYAGEVSDIAEEALSLPPNAVNEASGLKGLKALYTEEG